MKKVLLFIVAMSSLTSWGQITAKISGMIFNSTEKEIFLEHYDGNNYETLAKTKFDKDGNFAMDVTVETPDYYVLRVGEEYVNLILRKDQMDIKVYGDGASLGSHVNIVGDDVSWDMQKYLQIVNEWQTASEAAAAEIKADPSKQDEINRNMASEYQRFQGQTKSFIARNPNSPALYAAVGAIDAENDFVTYESVVQQLNRAFGDSPTIQKLNERYIATRELLQANDFLAPGKPAPDFEERMPDGTSMKLSDLQGKVVLLDFWASWCGPCRRENPNVVRLYHQYKDKGFTVMSVSLDKDKQKWLDAIEKDGLVWPYHVSDLKFWSSKAAKLYGVSGIPFTVLIDQEGNIVRTKLRGPELAEELARLLGS